MVDVITSHGHSGFPSKLKRPRDSDGGQYPRKCGLLSPEVELVEGREEIRNVHSLEVAAASRPHSKKYPPPKIRKGVFFKRTFPVKKNAPAGQSKQMVSDFNDSHSSCGIPMSDCEQLNASNATTALPCVEPKQDDVSMVDNGCKPLNVPIATHIFAGTDVKESSLSMVVGDELFAVDENHHVLKDEDEGDEVPSIAKQPSTTEVVRDEQCPTLYEVRDFSDEECGKALAEVDNSQLVVSENLFVTDNEHRNASDKVKEVINLFREVYLKLSKENVGKQKGSLSMQAASVLQKREKWINQDKRLGPIPGVEVGDYFEWRVELNMIGLHRQNICGIDYMEFDGRTLATSIVDSGRYDNVFESNDGDEFPDVLIYSGQGENPNVQNNKKILNDQKLERGNLALKNSAETKTPIRVIRKFSFKNASSKIEDRKYVYDGLYFVDGYREERASSGKLVFKFVLKRFPRQPKLAWENLVRREHVCVNDISLGKERIPIRAMNALDNEQPPLFNYVTSLTYPKSYHPSILSVGCDCSDGCSDSKDCPCVIKNGGEIPYNYEDCIMTVKPFIFECGPSCKCGPSCNNRVSQRGIRFPLEVFKTKRMGWGVRSRSFIACGSFICEYIGEILRDKEGEQRVGKDEYLFDLGKCFTIDAAQFGNVGRFINHSCSPNLFAQKVLFDYSSKSMPHIMLFAMEDIPPLKELSYDYNYKIGGVRDVNGYIKMKTCHCGSKECTGRLY